MENLMNQLDMVDIGVSFYKIAYSFPIQGLFVSPLIHVDQMVLSLFKSIASQNTSQFIPTHSNTHGIRITKQGLMREPPILGLSFFCYEIGHS
jgi:hypothetical protein